MKKQFTHKRLKNRLIIMFAALFGAFMLSGAYGQSITIDSEPTGPLYVGDTIEVEYTATDFDAAAVFYLVIDDGSEDSILAQSTLTTDIFEVEVPAGFGSSADLTVWGVVGDPYGPDDYMPVFGELSIAGASSAYDSYSYSDYNTQGTYLDFDDPGVRWVKLPAMDLDVDSATLVFDYRYWDWPDTLELVIQYSTNGGTTYTNLDTVSYINTSWQTYEMGLPAGALTTSTILRVRQLYSNLNNTENEYEVRIGNIQVEYGTYPDVTPQALGGNPFTLALPSTNITLIDGPVDAPLSLRAYAGDSIYIEATTSNFTTDTKFEIVFNNTGNINDPVHHLRNITLVSSTESAPGVFDWEFEAKLPTKMSYNDPQYFWVVPYKGTYEHGATISHDFATDNNTSHTILGESEISGTYGIYFTAENVRSVETPGLIIDSEGMLYVEIARRDNIFSPENTDIIAEYSIDGGTTFTEIGSISLNQANVYTDGATTFEMAIPAGAVSEETMFRFRQENINSGNLDQFYLLSYAIMLNANRFVDGIYADINSTTETVYDPDISFDQLDLPDLIYPGTTLDLEYTVTAGEFPANTTIRAEITNHNPDLVLYEATVQESGTLPVNVPAIYGGNYNLRLMVSTNFGNIYSNNRYINVAEVNMEILSVTGDPVRTYSNGDNYYLPGDEITVEYNIVGEAMHGIDLQIQDDNLDYHSIIVDDPADGQVVATIPTGISLPTNPKIRLVLPDTLYSTSTTSKYETFGEYDFPNNENDSMIMSTEGLVNPYNFATWSSYATFGKSGTRSYETKSFKIANHGYFYTNFLIPNSYHSWEGQVNKESPIHIQYSVDMGVTWINMNTFDPLSYATPLGSISYVTFNNEIPYEAISDQTRFRVIQNEDSALGFGENVWTLYWTAVYDGNPVILTSDNTLTLAIEQASISLGTLAKDTYGPGEAITVPYNIVGDFPGDVGFVSVLQNDAGEKFVIDTDDATGLVQLATNMPVNIPETAENGDEYDLYVWPYEKATPETEPIFGYMEDFDDESSDIISAEGEYYSTVSDYWDMDDSGPRYLLTKALPMVDGDSAYFDFYMQVWDNPLPSEGVIVEVTYDGGTTFMKVDTITVTDNYTIALATADMTEQTHLRWIQYWDNIAYDYNWRISSMEYRSDETNIIYAGYAVNNQPIANIEIDYPDFPSEFNVTNLQEDIVYSGGTFDMEVTLDEGYSPLPATTEYMFYLADGSNNIMIDPETGEGIMLGSMTGTGTTTLTVPTFVFNDQYRIVTTIQVDDPDSDDPYVYYEEVYASNSGLDLDVYNPQLKTIAATDEAYRGDEITVGWDLQTGSINTADYYFHLVVDNEILYTQKDAPVNFVENLPTDISTGNREVVVFVTTDSIYQEGESEELDIYDEEEWEAYKNVYINNYNYIQLNQVSAQNWVASNSFDMTLGGEVTFDISYGTTSNEFSESNNVIFEYSDDGGETYTELDMFPNEDYELGDGYQPQTYYFARGMLSDSTKFRFRRQNGSYNYVYVRDFILTQWSNEAPLQYVSDNVFVLEQEVALGELPISLCSGEAFTLDYSIDGMFGEKVIHYLQYSRNNSTSWNTLSNFTGATDGTGSIDVTIPSNYSQGDYKFRIYSEDATTNNPTYVTGSPTGEGLYFVPNINFTGTYLQSDLSLCEEGLVTYNIYSTQPYFMYQARDVATGEIYGDPVYNESGGTQTLQTGTVTEDMELEIFVSAMTPDMMKTCQTGVIDDRIEFTLVNERMLYMDDDYTSIYTRATDKEICEDNPDDLSIRAGYFDKDGNWTSSVDAITWYRDDKTTAVSSDTELDLFNQSGAYFAELMVDGCQFTTDTVKVDVLSVPDQPTVTATGELTFCEGGMVELAADMEYPYYRWYGGSSGNSLLSGSSGTLDVVSEGAYRLQVSDYPFEKSCYSSKSEPIQVNVIEDPETYISWYANGVETKDGALASCGEDVLLRVYNSPDSYSWLLDGEEFSSTYYTNSTIITATKTGYYNVRALREQNGVTCWFESDDSIFVQISDELTKPTLTLTGDDEFCSENGSAVLSTDEGYDGYRWTRDWSLATISDVVNENSIRVEAQGTYDYRVQIVDTLGCESDYSNAIEITVLPQPDRTASVYAVEDELCGSQEAEIIVSGHTNYGNRLLLYQLVNMTTGELVGDAATMTQADNGNFVLLNSGVITEDTEFGVMVTDANASGCSVMIDDTELVEVNTADIKVVGNMLLATPNAVSYQWYRNGQPLMGSTSDNIQVFDDAEYTVTVMYGFDCMLTSNASSVKNITGLSNILADDNISLYPNPTRDKVQVEFANNYAGDILIEVANIAGQVVHQQQLSKHNQFMNANIDLSQLQQGVYFVNFITEESTIVKSIVKQ